MSNESNIALIEALHKHYFLYRLYESTRRPTTLLLATCKHDHSRLFNIHNKSYGWPYPRLIERLHIELQTNIYPRVVEQPSKLYHHGDDEYCGEEDGGCGSWSWKDDEDGQSAHGKRGVE